MKLEVIITDEELQKFSDDTLQSAVKKVLRNDEQILEAIAKTYNKEVTRKVDSLFQKLQRQLEIEARDQLSKGVRDILRNIESDIRKNIDFSVFTTSSVLESLSEELEHFKDKELKKS